MGRIDRRWVGALIGGVLVATSPLRADQDATLREILLRAGGYVADFHHNLSGIVAEERYEQDWKVEAGGARSPKAVKRRVLGSDLVLVNPGGSALWMEFRDVFEVDGRPVRDRQDRLTKLFLDPSTSSAEQIGRILDDSSRYNIGDVERNVNTPVFALLFLELANQNHFKFKLTSDRAPQNTRADEATGAFRVSTEVFVVAFEERHSGTMIHTVQDKDLPSHGRFWIDSSGRVLMSELIVGNRQLQATIDVSYQSEPLLGFLVPLEMREHYERRKTHSIIEGRASYGRFRQFQVTTNEKFLVK